MVTLVTMLLWLPWLAPALAGVLAALAEWLHARRIRRIARLAFGAAGPANWTVAAPWLRIACAMALAWSLVVLAALPRADDATPPTAKPQHVVLALDVSPSMDITDAGADGRVTRAKRARELLRAALAPVDRSVGVSVIAFWGAWKPVAVDVRDPEVIANILDDLPLQHAFARGPTDLQQAVAGAAGIAREWPQGSAVLVVASDGDSQSTPEQRLPAAYRQVIVVGLGDQLRSTAIDGHASRQEAQSLHRLATRLGGRLHDGNVKDLPAERLAGMLTAPSTAAAPGLAAWALATLAIAATIEALLPLALALGGRRQPSRTPGIIHA